MNKFSRYLITALLGSLSFLSSSHGDEPPSATSWFLPRSLSDANAKISFKVDSTWHTVHGKTSGIIGKAWLSEPANPKSVSVQLEIPVSVFNTDNESRDEELRDIMNEKEFHNVVFSAGGLRGNCTPEVTKAEGVCQDILHSELKIREVKKELDIPITIHSEAEGFRVSGTLPVKWAEYNVEDPSIFVVASVDPVVEIEFNILLKK